MEIKRPARKLPARFFWATWALGPASYGATFAFCMAWWRYCDDPPNLMLACGLVLTHSAAGLMTVTLVFVPGPQRWKAEFWVLMLYWLGIAIWLLLPLAATSDARIDPIPWIGTRTAAGAVVLVPAVALLRRAWPRAPKLPV